MSNNKNKPALAVLFLSFVFSFSAAAVRCGQLLLYTDSDTGMIVYGAENTILQFYILTVISVALLGAFVLLSRKELEGPFEIQSNGTLSLFSFLAAAGMFYDFVHQCLNCYFYIADNSYVAANRLLPMILTAVFALLSSVYFIFSGISFKNTRYDFRRLWFFRITPVLWAVVNFFVLLTDYSDNIHALETLLKYAAFLFALLFFLFFAIFVDGEKGKCGVTVFFGFLYAGISFSLSFGRILCFILGNEINAEDFSSPAFLFTGLFAFACSFLIYKRKRD